VTLGYDVGVNLISGLLAGGITSAATFGIVRTREWLPDRRLWRLRDPSSLTVIVSTNATPRHLPGSTRPGTGVGQVRGIAVLTPSLIRAYRTSLRSEMVLLSADADPSDFKGDLILLGGPRTNAVTELAFAAEGLPVYMRDSRRQDGTGPVDSRIHWHPPGQEEPEILDTADEGDCTYGFVLRHQNVLDPGSGSSMWIFAGTSTFGTQAAAEWFSANRETVRMAGDSAAFVVRAGKWGNPVRGITTPTVFRSVPRA
jgi:hypothetical protein